MAMAKTYQLGPIRRAVNVLMKPLVRLGIGGKSTYLLTTTGRRTGQQRTTPVILVEKRWTTMACVALRNGGLGSQRACPA